MPRVLVLLLALILSCAPAAIAQTPFAADALDCSTDSCTASGNVLLINDDKVITADSVSISVKEGIFNLDRLRGMKLRIKRRPLPQNLSRQGYEAVNSGKNKMELGGNLQQEGCNYLGEELSFTMCDCGAGCPPSWWIKAKRAKLELTGQLTGNGQPAVEDPMGIKNRIHLYNLVPHIRPFGAFDMPVFWLPYISYPLQKRAFGLLPLRVTSMFSTWPSFDLPLFIPLGQSYDLTLVPGYFPTRGPRAGLEFRYAPAEGTYGELKSQYTAHIHSPELLFAGDRANLDPRRQNLVHRWDLRWHHQSEFARQVSMRWDIDVVGDRLYLYDFWPGKRSATYLPSRFQLLWQSKANIVLQVAGDFYQDMRPHWPLMTEASADSCRTDWRDECNIYYNWHSISSMVQRLPAVRLVMSPTSWGHLPLWSGGEFNTTVYAPWNNYGAELFGVLNGRLEIGGSAQKWRVPLAFNASYNYTQAFDGARGSAQYHFPRINIFSDLHLGRLFTYKDGKNRLTNRLLFKADYLLIPIVFQNDSPRVLWNAVQNSPFYDSIAALSDEHLQLKPVHQILLSTGTSVRLFPLGLHVQLLLSQGFNLGAVAGAGAAGVGQFAISAKIDIPGWFDGGLKLSYDWQSGLFREIDAHGKLFWGKGVMKGSYLSASYYHLLGGNDQLLATIYELIPGGGFPAALATGEDHYLNAFLNVAVKNWTIRYGLRYIFRLDSLSAGENDERFRGDFDRHYITLGYKSACDCWAVNLSLILPHQYLLGNTSSQFAPSFNITLDLAGLALGLK